MCSICDEIDKRIQEYRWARKMTTDLLEIDELISQSRRFIATECGCTKTPNDRPSQ